MPLVEANNFTIVDYNCEMEGKSRKSYITIGWPADSLCYSLAILFSAVRVKHWLYCVLIVCMSQDFTKGNQHWDINQFQFHYNTSCNPDFSSPAEC